MKNKFKLIKRGSVWYSEEKGTRKRRRESLGTECEVTAGKLIAVMNDAASCAASHIEQAKAHLKFADPRIAKRTWSDAFSRFVDVGKAESTRERKSRAFRRGGRFEGLRDKVIIDTVAEDFHPILDSGEVSNIQYLKQIQQWALNEGWLLSSVIAPKQIVANRNEKRPQRAITLMEQEMILSRETNDERRHYYEMLWLTGAAQSDCANLKAEDFDLDAGILFYSRSKTGQNCLLSIGSDLMKLISNLPSEGYLFPKVQTGDHRSRGKEFRRVCKILGIDGISLHSFRYSFAERACEAGIEERFAMAALGHASKAVHRAYAKNAKMVCPPIPISCAIQARNDEPDRDAA